MTWARIAGLLFAAAATASVCPAFGQVGTDAARRALIEQARAASRAGDHARAVELATRASGVRATPSLRYFLATEHLALGHAVEALEHAGECVARASVDDAVPDRDDLLTRCRAIASDAEERVARITVRVPSPAPEGLQVHVGDVLLAPSLHGIAVPVAPGDIEVRATAAGRRPFHVTRALEARAHAEVTVELPAAEPPTPAPSLRVIAPAPPVARPVASPIFTPAPREAASQGAGPWVLGGVGLAGLATAGALFAVALDARDTRDAVCPSANDCDPVTASSHDGRYRDFTLGAGVTLALGGALVACAVVWWAVARASPPQRARLGLTPSGLALRW